MRLPAALAAAGLFVAGGLTAAGGHRVEVPVARPGFSVATADTPVVPAVPTRPPGWSHELRATSPGVGQVFATTRAPGRARDAVVHHAANRRRVVRHPAAPGANRPEHHAAPGTPAGTSPTTTSPPPAAPPATSSAASASASGYGCGAALAYLSAHAAPGFQYECPGYADGRQAMTCVNVSGLCEGEHLIAIADPCPAAYMNEASNSWVLIGESSAPIDPYGYCTS